MSSIQQINAALRSRGSTHRLRRIPGTDRAEFDRGEFHAPELTAQFIRDVSTEVIMERYIEAQPK